MSRRDSALGDRGLGFASCRGYLCRSLNPGGCLQLLEGLARFIQQRLCFAAAALRCQPFGVFELGDGEVESEAELAKDRSGTTKALVDAFDSAVLRIEAGAEASAVSAEERRQLARLKCLNAAEELLGLREVAEHERRLERLDHVALDARVGNRELTAKREPALGDGERLGRSALSSVQPSLQRREETLVFRLFCIAGPLIRAHVVPGGCQVALLATDGYELDQLGARHLIRLQLVGFVCSRERLGPAPKREERGNRPQPRQRQLFAVAELSRLRLDLARQLEHLQMPVGVL